MAERCVYKWYVYQILYAFQSAFISWRGLFSRQLSQERLVVGFSVVTFGRLQRMPLLLCAAAARVSEVLFRIANSADLTGLSLEFDLAEVEVAHAGEAREHGPLRCGRVHACLHL